MQVTTVSAMLAQLHQREAITMQIASASRTVAMLRSRDAVKDSLRRSGVKVSHLAASEITSWAKLYLEDHAAELMGEAIATIERWTREGVFGRKAERALCAALVSDAQTSSEPKSTTSVVQMSGAK